MADQQQPITEPGAAEPDAKKEKRDRHPTEYVVLRQTGSDPDTYVRIGEKEQTFQGYNRGDALNDALEVLEDEQRGDWLVAVPESSFKAARRKPPKPQRAAFETA